MVYTLALVYKYIYIIIYIYIHVYIYIVRERGTPLSLNYIPYRYIGLNKTVSRNPFTTPL